jgi:hypothetical protein
MKLTFVYLPLRSLILSVRVTSLNKLSVFSVGNALVNYNTDPLSTCHLDFQRPGKDPGS